MHVETLIHKFFSNVIHKSRLKLLVCILNAVIRTKQLKLSVLGRALDLPIQERSGIRKLDRFLGNKFFQRNNIHIYQTLITRVIGAKIRPIIIIDWTKIPNCNHYCLRAALATEGRAITLYEEVHPKANEGNAKIHRCFLKTLKKLLPEQCKPIIVTDAGFRVPWFREVVELSWDFVGRVLNRNTCYKDQKSSYQCTTLYKLASYSPKYLGDFILNKKKSGLKTSFYLIKQKPKGRKHYRKDGKIASDKDSRMYASNNSRPWLLVSTLKGVSAAKKVVKIYKRRMTIEENFRDMKSSQYGFGFEHNKTIREERLIVWLLLSSLANFIAWIIGSVAEQLNLHYQFQANSIKKRRVLSICYLGCQIIRKRIKIPIDFDNWNFDFREIYL